MAMDADRPADAEVSAARWSRFRAAPPRWLTVLLAAVLAGLLATGGVLGWQLREAQAQQDRHTAILQAAAEHTGNFLTMDYRQARRDTAKVIAGATGEFRKQYSGSRSRLHKLVEQNKSVSTGKVLATGVVSADADSARVIVVADSDVTNISTKEPQPRHYRLQLDLAKQGGRWLLASLQFVG